MATRKQLVARITALRCTLDEEGTGGYSVDAPRGKVHAGSGTHTFGYWYRGWTRPDLYQATLDDLKPGLADCDGGTECDACHPCDEVIS